MIVLTVFFVCCYTQKLEYFRDRKIYIVSAAYSKYKIVYDVAEINDPPVLVWSDNYKSAKQIYDDISFITKYGSDYKIKVGPKYLCYQNNNVVTCKENNSGLWQITKLTFGFTISTNNLCITVSNTKLYLERCKSNKDQIFEFVVRPAFLDCLELINFGANTTTSDKLILNKIKKSLKNEDVELLKDKIADKLQIDDVKALEKDPNPETFNKYLDKTIPEIEKKSKIKEILDKLWEHDFGIPWWKKAWNAIKNFFCS